MEWRAMRTHLWLFMNKQKWVSCCKIISCVWGFMVICFINRTKSIWNEPSFSHNGVSTMEQLTQLDQIDHYHYSKDWLECYTCYSIFSVIHRSFQHLNCNVILCAKSRNKMISWQQNLVSCVFHCLSYNGVDYYHRVSSIGNQMPMVLGSIPERNKSIWFS